MSNKMWGEGTPWKTEAKFWSWLRGGLRRAVWNKHVVKLNKKKAERYKAPLGRNGAMVWTVRCAICNQETREAASNVDHIKPAGSLKCVEDIQPFVEHLAFVKEEDIQILCKGCHGIKTYQERYDVTWDQAKKRKQEIADKKKGG